MTLRWIIFFFSQKVTKKEKKSLISPGKIKNEKNRNENENPIILALLIGKEAVLTRTRITNNFMNVFNGVTSPRVFSYRFVLPMGFNLNLTCGLKPQVSGIKMSLFTDDIFTKLSGS